MNSNERFRELDEYFYGDSAARRRDFLISGGIGFAALGVCKAANLGEFYSLIICTALIAASMLVLISRYHPRQRPTKTLSKKSAFWVVMPVSAMSLLLIAISVIPNATEQIVEQIRVGKNPAEQNVALLTAAYNFQQDARTKRKVNPSDLAHLTSAILKLTDEANAPPEAWKAAASLISYRSAALTDFKTRTNHPCLLQDKSPSLATDREVKFWLRYRDCTFDLNDLDFFYRQYSTVKMSEFTGSLPKTFYFNFNNATVKFDPSRPSIPFAGLTFDSCLLEVRSDRVPLRPQEPLLRAFLDKSESKFTIGEDWLSGAGSSM